MSTHVIVGAGAVGSTTAKLLAERGEQVRIVTRSGGGPVHPAIERIAADASDASRLTEIARGAVAIYNAANPQYHRWLTDWPPLAAAILTAASSTGATLVTAGNLYGYGPVADRTPGGSRERSPAPMTEQTPLAATHPKLKLRADMWREMLAAHEAGRIRAVEVRGSDYIQAQSIFSFALGKPILAGKRGYSPAPLDVPHTWTSINDMAAMLVIAGADERAWGRAWHVPSNDPLTVRELARRFAQVNGVAEPKLSAIPYPMLWATGLFSPMVKELRTAHYQFARPFIMDSTQATETFGLKAQPLEEALIETAGLLR